MTVLTVLLIILDVGYFSFLEFVRVQFGVLYGEVFSKRPMPSLTRLILRPEIIPMFSCLLAAVVMATVFSPALRKHLWIVAFLVQILLVVWSMFTLYAYVYPWIWYEHLRF